MHLHRAVELLKTLNEDELKEFGGFIESPFFNNRDVLVRLFKTVVKYAPDYKSKVLTKEKLYTKIYPGKKYNEQTLRSRMSEFASLIREFLTQKSLSEDEFEKKKYFIKELTKRKKFELAEKFISEAEKGIAGDKDFGNIFFKQKLQLLTEHASLWIAKDEKDKSLESAYGRGEFLLNYFLLEYLKINHDIICIEIEKKEKKDFSLANLFFEKFNFEEYLNVLKEKNYEHYALIASYYYGNMSMRKPEEEYYFYQLKNILYEHYKIFALEELYNYWSLLSNCAYVNYLKKGKKFLNEGHEINKFFIENEIYDNSKPFSPLGFQNILMNAVMVEDFDWGEKFIDEFKQKLPTEAANNRYNFCKALIYFERKNYGKSNEFLNKVKFIDVEMNLGVRLIYIKNFYEMGLVETVDSQIDSLRHFVSKNIENLHSFTQENIKTTLHYISKMVSAKFGMKKLDYSDLKEAESNSNFLQRKWILEKIKELL